MTPVLARWNELAAEVAAREVLPCCGSAVWAEALAARRPIVEEIELLAASNAAWLGLGEQDWRQAFENHPRIGESTAVKQATAESLRWSSEEQQGVEGAARWLYEGNRRYEARFGRIFIVCASGKSGAEILAILEARMKNDPATELREAVEQQRQITTLRLRRWLHGE